MSSDNAPNSLVYLEEDTKQEMFFICVSLIYLLYCCDAFKPPSLSHSFSKSSRAVQASRELLMAHGGKIVVSGIGSSENDEFMLNLLNEQVRITALVLV